MCVCVSLSFYLSPLSLPFHHYCAQNIELTRYLNILITITQCSVSHCIVVACRVSSVLTSNRISISLFTKNTTFHSTLWLLVWSTNPVMSRSRSLSLWAHCYDTTMQMVKMVCTLGVLDRSAHTTGKWSFYSLGNPNRCSKNESHNC